MDFYQIAVLLAFLFPLAYSPGPGNMFFAANGARFGLRSTLGPTIGYHIATLGVSLSLGLGFSATIVAAPKVFTVVKTAGSLYVLWLAWRLWRSGRVDQEEAKSADFWDGIVLLVLNPKAYVIIALMFSQFLTEDSRSVDVAVIAAVFTLNNLVAFTSPFTAGASVVLRRPVESATRSGLLSTSGLSTPVCRLVNNVVLFLTLLD